MSIDVLQNKIRKLKNPVMLWLCPTPDVIPPAVVERSESLAAAYGAYCLELLEALAESVCAVRVGYDAFSLLGAEGLKQLEAVLARAKELELYILLDWQHIEDCALAEASARRLLREDVYSCDALSLSIYAGSDTVKPYINAAGSKDLFVSIKTGNKSGAELQDLMTGGRWVHTAAADMVSRWGEGMLERCGYSRIAGIAGAVNAPGLRTLRQKYNRMFLLVEGLETSGANAKNCSAAFDRFGHGAVCCAGRCVLTAWQEREDGDYVAAAKEAVERWKRNLSRYVTIL